MGANKHKCMVDVLRGYVDAWNDSESDSRCRRLAEVCGNAVEMLDEAAAILAFIEQRPLEEVMRNLQAAVNDRREAGR